MEQEENLKKNINTKKNKLVILVSIVISILLVIIFLIINHFTNPVTRFKKSLETNDISAMKKIYEDTDNENNINEIKKLFAKKLSSILENYINDKSSYEDTLNEIKKYNDIKGLYSCIDASKNDLESLKISKDKFSLAKEYEIKNDILNAIKNYSEVINLDKNNYQIAQEYIKANLDTLKQSIFLEIDNLLTDNNYKSANEKLEELEVFLKNDTDITNKTNEINKKKQEYIKHYTDNSQYQCFRDDTYNIKFYYDTTKLKYYNNPNTKLALRENYDGLFGYSTFKLLNNYDKNEYISQLISKLDCTIIENKDITISKIKPIEVRYLEGLIEDSRMKIYVIFKKDAVCTFLITSNIYTETPSINEILDTIISE